MTGKCVGRIVVTGGAGFVGSHLCESLLARGNEVVCVDNLSSGRTANIAPFMDHAGFEFVEADIRHKPTIDGSVNGILNFASLASPPEYLAHPLMTLETGSIGTQWCLDLAEANDARMVLASTSEIYGDPDVHPQTEDYWGNVNPIGIRSVYDEAKRYAEAITMAYSRARGVNTGIVRIFNTYGPRMRPDDGRVVSNFINQALVGEPLTIYGDGSQTRSYCFVDDLVAGILALLDSSEVDPVNLGNPAERSVAELASLIVERTNSGSEVSYHELPLDDPTRRRPDISRAMAVLGWSPTVDLAEGLDQTIDHFRSLLESRTAR